MGRVTRNLGGPACAFPQAMPPPPGMAVPWMSDYSSASHVYRKGAPAHNTMFTETASSLVGPQLVRGGALSPRRG